MPKPTRASKSRILALDYLRGFFITVIIIDHLNRWPNIFMYATGKDDLWASAAEGFVIISGLMLGYIRGFKARNDSFRAVLFIVLKRSVILYFWAVLCTLILSVISWYAPFQGPIAHVPVPVGDWGTLIFKTLTMQYIHSLPYFLYIYAVLLALAPLALWSLRRGLWWLVIVGSLVFWVIGVDLSIEPLQWAPAFFIPAAVGFYLEPIRDRILHLSKPAKVIGASIIIGVSAITIMFASLEMIPDAELFFGRSPLNLTRIGIAFIWFAGFLIVFQLVLPWLKRWLGWLLGVFGNRSLTAYILHPVPLFICSVFIPPTTNFWCNTILATSCVLMTWGLVKIPFLHKIIPR